MTQKLLAIVLPLVLPFLAYGFYLILVRRRVAGGLAPETAARLPWLPLFLTGIVLMAIALVAIRFTSGHAPGTALEPPRFIDGEVVPSHPIETQ